MAKKKTTETVYLVAWPDYLVAKAGITSGRRWASFLNRGAILYRLALFPFADWRVALDYEIELHEYFTALCPLAFASRGDSETLLGRLGGHCETYRLPDWQVLLGAPGPPPPATLWTARDYYQAPPVLPWEVPA